MARSHERDQLEMKALTEPANIGIMCRLADIYIGENRLNKAKKQVEMAFSSYRPSAASTELGLQILDVAIIYWKADRFVSKGSLRLNYAIKRRDFLSTILAFALRLQPVAGPSFAQILQLKLAYLKESLGSYQDALTILSDLITQQATNGVDLSFIIFKAAILLRHKGNAKQAIEYLEFLQEDPPLQDGYTKLHIMAYLLSTYEQSGDKYKFFLNKGYRDLAAAATEEANTATATAANTASTNKKHLKRIETMLKSPSSTTSSDFWEIMALQSLERCEYVLAAEFLQLASMKAPGKGSLLHSLAEVLMLLSEQDQAERIAERALELLPQSSELRNLLLQINPEKWTDRIRFLGTTKTASAVAGDGDAKSNIVVERDINDPKASKLAKKLRSTANNAMEVVQKVAANNTTNASTSKKKAAADSRNNRRGSSSRSSSPLDAHRPVSPLPLAIPITGQQSSQSPSEGADMLKILSSSSSPTREVLRRDKVKEEEEEAALPSQRRKRIGKPVKPPALDEEEMRYLKLALSGNNNIHFYDPTLEAMAAIRRNSERERKAALREKMTREMNNSSSRR